MSRISELFGFNDSKPKQQLNKEVVLDMLKDMVVDSKVKGKELRLTIPKKDALGAAMYLHQNFRNFVTGKEDAGDNTVIKLATEI